MRHWIGLVDDLSRYPTEYIGYQMLTEAGRIDFLMKTYGMKLAAKYTSEQEHLPVAVTNAIGQEPGQEIAQKVLSYIVSYDPTRNHEYAQWLALRYLKGTLALEDMPRAYDYLEVFHRAKKVRSQQVAHRITDTNIMNYADLDAVYHAIAPFMTDVSRAPATPDDRLIRRMSQEDQATIAYDGEDMTVVIPHTVDAAKFWGRGSNWCTTWEPPRQNYFDYYNRLGPLYIIILKPGGEKYQFTYDWQEGGRHGQFNDSMNRGIDMPAFVRQHPALIKIVGEQKMLPWADQIGLDLFGPNIREMLGAQRMGKIVAQNMRQYDNAAEALNDVPTDMLTSFAFQQSLLSLYPPGLRYLPEDAYRANIVELLRQCDKLFQYLPTNLKTPETAEAAATRMQRYQDIESIPPELWSPTTASRYYLLRADYDRTLRLQDVPEEYRSQKVVVNTLAHNPDDIPAFEALLNGRIAREIVQIQWEAGWKLPAKYFDEHMAKMLSESRWPQALALFVRIPAEYWTAEAARTVARNKDTKFTQLPEQFRTPRIISDFIDAAPQRINEVPPELLTKAVLVGLDENDFKVALKYAEPGRITEDVITEWLRGVHNTSSLDSFVNDLPKRYFTDPVMSYLVDRGAIPMSQIPLDKMNDHTLYDRLTFRADTIDELGAIPAEKFTIQLAERVARQYPGMVRRFPDHVLTGSVLRALVKAITEDEDRRNQQTRNRYPYSVRHQREELDPHIAESVKAAFARFPASAWHGDDVAKMMQLKLFVPEISQIPLAVINHSILELLAQQAPEQLAQVRATKRMEEEVIAAVRKEPRVLLTINPKLLTEPVSYMALDRWAETYKHRGWAPTGSRGHYLVRTTDGDTLKQALDRLPRKLWSQRCWDAAVTYVVPYEKVPAAFRNDPLTRIALLREPETIKVLPKPLEFLNQYIKQRDAGVDWYRAMEKLGFIRKGRGWISTEGDLERTPVEGHPGFMVSVVEAGKNKRIYLYKNDEQVLILHTKDGKVRLDKAWQYEEYRPVLIQVARDYLSDYDLGDLDRLKIYRVNGVIGGGEEQVKRERYKWTTRKHIKDPKDPWRYNYVDEEHVGQIDWTDVPRRNGHVYSAYLGNDKLLQVTTEGQGYRQVSTHDGTKIFDYQKALPHITEIWHFLQSNRVDFFWQLRDIGLTTKSKGWSSPEVSILAERKVGEAGDLTVWTNGSKVGLYGSQGYVGSGWLTARGKITKVDVDYDYTKMEAKITDVLAKAARFIMAKEGGQFDMPVTITPNKKEEEEAASEEAAEE